MSDIASIGVGASFRLKGKPRMICRTLVIAGLTVGTFAALAPAQAMPEQESQRTSTRYNSRGTRGLVKLGIFGVVALIGVGGWIAKKMKGE